MANQQTYAIATDVGNVYLYEYSTYGSPIFRLQKALKVARLRINMDDYDYATRIIISQLIGNDWTWELGLGLGLAFNQSDHSVPLVDLVNKTVTLYDKSMETEKYTMTIDAFIERYEHD